MATYYMRPPTPPGIKARHIYTQGSHPQGSLLCSLCGLSVYWGIYLVDCRLEGGGRIPAVAYDQKLCPIPPNPK